MATPKDLPRDIGGFIRDLRHNARISLRQLAEQAGVSNPYLSQIERGLRKPSAEVLQQIASALRVSTPAMYLRAGLLDSEGQQGVLAAIAVDPELTMAQKQSLTQIYETFRGENARQAAATAAAVPEPEDAPADEPDRETRAVMEAVAAVETGATPMPTGAAEATEATEAKTAQKKTAQKKTAQKKTARKRAARPAADEETS
jgi:transcriptional regulator with XRE-family HTH domain